MGNLIPRGDTRRNEHASRMDRGWAGVKNAAQPVGPPQSVPPLVDRGRFASYWQPSRC